MGMKTSSLVTWSADPTSRTENIFTERLDFMPSAPEGFVWFPRMLIKLDPFWALGISVNHVTLCTFYLKCIKASHLTQICESSPGMWGPTLHVSLPGLLLFFCCWSPQGPSPSLTHCEVLLKLWRLSQIWDSRRFIFIWRDLINQDVNDVTSGSCSIEGLTFHARPQVSPYLAAVVLPEPLLQRLSQLAQQEAVV